MSDFEALKGYLPPFLLENKVFSNLIESVEKNDFDKYDEALEDLLLQVFPQTATWSLRLWEEFCGIITIEGLDVNIRRSKVMAKLSQVSPITPNIMKSMISKFTDGIVKIIQDTSQYSFFIDFQIKSKILNLKEMYETIEYVKPAHLDYDLALNFNISNKKFYMASCLICGETITVYPWSKKEIQSVGNFHIAAGNNSADERVTIYPRKEA